jgi:hypothetical protein
MQTFVYFKRCVKLHLALFLLFYNHGGLSSAYYSHATQTPREAIQALRKTGQVEHIRGRGEQR